ncbi:MAG: Spx/MgsR family RNA polymerase-binding regulatory protein [Pseudomonadota bacterium]
MKRILYGLKQCDTCRTAMRWMDGHGLAYTFVDIRAQTPSTEEIQSWLDAVGDAKLVNRRSTTWRGLSESDRASAGGSAAAQTLQQHPTLVKRPVVALDSTILVGFSEADWAAALLE